MTDAEFNRKLSEHMAELARKGNKRRWAGKSKKQKADATEAMRTARWARQRNGKGGG